MPLIMTVDERRPPPYGCLPKCRADENETHHHPLPKEFAAQNMSSPNQEEPSISTNDKASSGGMSTTSNCSSYLTNSSNMSIDTRAFRRDARRLNGQKKAERTICHDAEVYSPLRLSNHSWDFEHVTGLPVRPPDADVIMEEAAEEWYGYTRPSTPALPGHEPVSSFADWHSYEIE